VQLSKHQMHCGLSEGGLPLTENVATLACLESLIPKAGPTRTYF